MSFLIEFLIEVLLNGLLHLLQWGLEEHPFLTAILILGFIALCFLLVRLAQ